MVTSFWSGPVTGTGDGLADAGSDTEGEAGEAEEEGGGAEGEGEADADGGSETVTEATASSVGSAAFPSSPDEQPASASAAAVHTITELRMSILPSLPVVCLCVMSLRVMFMNMRPS
ncbi:hypothetical protein OG440_35395 [Streptomyces sp. NBC_00637]|uniref:hypothetical protein n=1 Tax=Streptomyces sp. NBC_00637 TaxID=2903667 RepID=UPI003244FEB9